MGSVAAVGLALATAGCGGRHAQTTRVEPVPRENGFYACQNMPAGVRDGAGRLPDTPAEYASRLRRYVRLQLRNLSYPQAFRGCLDAVWSAKLGPRPSP